MSTYRQAEIYLQRRIVSALLAIKNESENPESIAEKYILEGLQRDHPGIMDLVDECEIEFESAKQKNKARLAEWKKNKSQIL